MPVESHSNLNSFDPAIFQQAAQIATQNLQLQAQQQQGMQAQQIQREQMAAREREVNARGKLDHQRAAADDRNRQRQLQITDRDSQQRFGLARLQESKRMGDQERLDTNWQQESAQLLDKDMSEMLKAARAIEYTPEGRRMYAQMSAEARALQGSRAKMRPAQYSQMAGDFMERFAEADLGSYQAEPPSIKDEMASRFIDIGNGRGLLMQPDKTFKDINTTALKDVAAGSPLLDGEKPQVVPAMQRMQQDISGMKQADIAKLEKDVRTELELEYTNDNPDAVSVPKIGIDAIHDRIEERYKNREALERRMYGVPDPEVAQQPGERAGRTPAGQAFLDRIKGKQPAGTAAMGSGLRPEPNPQPPVKELPGSVEFKKTPEAKEARKLMEGVSTPEEAAAVAQQFIQSGMVRMSDRPESARIQERMAARGMEGDWTRFITEESIMRHVEEGSKDPFVDVVKHAEFMLGLPDGFDFQDAPLEWQERMDQDIPKVHVESEYKKLNPGDIFIDGITGKIVRKPVEPGESIIQKIRKGAANMLPPIRVGL